jgi:hypothetical protein
MLEEHQIFLSLLKKELKFREAKLVEEQARILHSIDRRDLLVELEELRVWVAGVEDEHTAKAGELSALVIEASNALIDLMMIPIQDVPNSWRWLKRSWRRRASSWGAYEKSTPSMECRLCACSGAASPWD